MGRKVNCKEHDLGWWKFSLVLLFIFVIAWQGYVHSEIYKIMNENVAVSNNENWECLEWVNNTATAVIAESLPGNSERFCKNLFEQDDDRLYDYIDEMACDCEMNYDVGTYECNCREEHFVKACLEGIKNKIDQEFNVNWTERHCVKQYLVRGL